ncbi:MAG: hypothetical protein IT370_09405 [Deltaproteobacteria bacterium]|nr:hypothetical protein [Deltaproteobacteria bacterium]
MSRLVPAPGEFDPGAAIIALGSFLMRHEPLTSAQRDLRAHVFGAGITDYRKALAAEGFTAEEMQRLGVYWAQRGLATDAGERHSQSCTSQCKLCGVALAIVILDNADDHDPHTAPLLAGVRKALGGMRAEAEKLDAAVVSYAEAQSTADGVEAKVKSHAANGLIRSMARSLGVSVVPRERSDFRDHAGSAQAAVSRAIEALQTFEADLVAAFPDPSMLPTRKDAKKIVGPVWSALYMAGAGMNAAEIASVIDDGAGGDAGQRSDRVRKWLERSGDKPRDHGRGAARDDHEDFVRCDRCQALVWKSEAPKHEIECPRKSA